MIFRSELILLALLITGCSADESAREPSPAPREVVSSEVRPDSIRGDSDDAAPIAHMAIGPGAVTLVLPEGRTRHFEFGGDFASAVNAISAADGEATMTDVAECGLQAATWGNGLSAYASNGVLVGWSLGEAGITTMAGVGIGSTLREVSSSLAVERIPDSTIGVEYVAGEMAMILDGDEPDSRVTHLWSGQTCIAR